MPKSSKSICVEIIVPCGNPDLPAVLPRLSGGHDVDKIRDVVMVGGGRVLTAANLRAILDMVTRDLSTVIDDGPIGSFSDRDELLPDLEVLQDGEVLSATSALFMNHHWSDLLIHGPDMMFSISPLIETMLAPDEKVTTMNVRFQAKVTRELKMFASFSDGPVAVPQPYTDRKPDVVADFETDKGSRIKFCAFQADKVVRRNSCGNLAARNIAREFQDCCEVAGMNVRIFDLASLSPKFRPNFNELNDSTPLGTELNTAMELVLLAMGAITNSRRSIIPAAAWHLAASFKDFKPPALEDLSPPTRLEVFVDLANIKGNGDGFRFLPIKFAFKRGDKVVGSGTYIDAYPSSDRFADAWTARHLG